MQTILVCDDDKQIVEAINIYLTGEGFRVIKAYDGYEALELLEKNEVNLMIVDVMMPGLDGIRTTLKVRETSSIPIIILSAKSEDTDKILGLNIGADDYTGRIEIVVQRLALAQEFRTENDIAAARLFADVRGVAYGDGALDDHYRVGIDLHYKVDDRLHRGGVKKVLLAVVVGGSGYDDKFRVPVGVFRVEGSLQVELLLG